MVFQHIVCQRICYSSVSNDTCIGCAREVHAFGFTCVSLVVVPSAMSQSLRCPKCDNPLRGNGVGYCPRRSKGLCSWQSPLGKISVRGEGMDELAEERPSKQSRAEPTSSSTTSAEPAPNTFADRVRANLSGTWDGSDFCFCRADSRLLSLGESLAPPAFGVVQKS